MAINTTIDLLQALHRSMSGIRKAPNLAKYPTVIDTADLPFVIAWPSDGQFAIKGGGFKQSHRTYRVLVYVEPIGQNDIPSRAVAAVALLQTMLNAYISAANVPLADPTSTNPYQVTIESGPTAPHTDGGIVSNLVFGGKPYHGFEIRLNVRELWST